MLDAGDAEKDRTGCRLEELLTGSGGPCADSGPSTASLRAVLRKAGGGGQLSGERGGEFSRGNLLALRYKDKRSPGK